MGNFMHCKWVTALLCVPTALALRYATNVTYSYGSGANAGPGNVTSVVFTYSGQNAGPNGLPSSINTKPIRYRSGSPMTGDTINVYVVFYGAKKQFGFFTPEKIQVYVDFINNVASTSWYAVAKRYGIANNVRVAKTVNAECYYHAFAYGCDIGINQVEKILYDQMYSVERETTLHPGWKPEVDSWGYGLPRDPNAIYLVIAAPETTEAFANDGSGAHVGRDYCAYHSTFSTKHVGRNEDSNVYKYGYIHVPNKDPINVGSIMWSLAELGNVKPASRCFFDRNKSTSPNGFPEVDMSIGLVGHELVEILVSPDARTTYFDDDNNELMDKCESWFSDLKSVNGFDYNLEVAGRKYLVSPVWDLDTQTCAMAPASGWRNIPGGLIQVSISGHRACGVNGGYEVWCSTAGSDNWSKKPGGVKWISVDGARACGVGTDTAVYCADNIDNPSWVHLGGGNAVSIDVHGDTVCHTNTASQIWCSNYMKTNYRQLPGALARISLYGSRICGTATDSTIWCADDVNNVQWSQLSGGLSQVDIYQDLVCGVNSAGDVWCSNYKQNNWVLKAGKMKHLSIDATRAYGIDFSNAIYYHATLNTATNEWRNFPGDLMQQSVSGDRHCGVNSRNEIWCTIFGLSNWSKRTGLAKWISLDGVRACVVGTDTAVHCTHNIDNPSWTYLGGGNAVSIDVSGDTVCHTNTAAQIWCSNFMNTNYRQLPGALTRVSLSGGRICGAASDLSIWCADDVNNVHWSQQSGALAQVDLSGDILCGVNGSGYIFCATYKQNNWVQKPGVLKQISIDGKRAVGSASNDGIFYNSALN